MQLVISEIRLNEQIRPTINTLFESFVYFRDVINSFCRS